MTSYFLFVARRIWDAYVTLGSYITRRKLNLIGMLVSLITLLRMLRRLLSSWANGVTNVSWPAPPLKQWQTFTRGANKNMWHHITHWTYRNNNSNKLSGRPPQYAPAPACKLTFDLVTLKVMSESTCDLGCLCDNFSIGGHVSYVVIVNCQLFIHALHPLLYLRRFQVHTWQNIGKRPYVCKRSRLVFKLGDMSCFNQHPWMHLNLNRILYTYTGVHLYSVMCHGKMIFAVFSKFEKLIVFDFVLQKVGKP